MTANHAKLGKLDRHVAQSAIRSVGRLGGDSTTLNLLLNFFITDGWGRYAADAMGDMGDPRAIEPLMVMYRHFAPTGHRLWNFASRSTGHEWALPRAATRRVCFSPSSQMKATSSP